MAWVPIVLPSKFPPYIAGGPDYSARAIYKHGKTLVQFDIEDVRKETLPIKNFQGKIWILWKFKQGNGDWEDYALYDEWTSRLQEGSGEVHQSPGGNQEASSTE